MFILFAFKSIMGNIPLDLELATPGRKTRIRTSDCHTNKLWHFTNASLFPMEHWKGEEGLQGEEGLPF